MASHVIYVLKTLTQKHVNILEFYITAKFGVLYLLINVWGVVVGFRFLLNLALAMP